MTREWAEQVFRFVLVILVTVGSIIAIYFVSKVAYPFIIGLAIALLINPVVDFLEKRWRFPRLLSVLTAITVIIGLFAGLITLLIAEIVAGTSYLAKVVPEHITTMVQYIEKLFAGQVIPFYNKIAGILKSLDAGQQDTILNSITATGDKITASLTNFIQDFFLKLPALVSWIPNAATVIVFSLLATFFISKDWHSLKDWAGKFVPEKAKTSGVKVFADLRKALLGFFKAQLTLISLTLVIVLIGLLVLKVKYAITIALITGIVDLLPYLGTGAVFIPWIIYEAVTGNIGFAVGLGILYTVVVVQRQVMEPKILSSNIGLNPLATLIALFVGFKLIGFLGLILGPVILVLLTTLQKAHVFSDIWAYIKGKPPIIK